MSWLRWIVAYLFDCVLVEEIDIRLVSEAPPYCESVPRLYESTLKRREGQRTGSLFSTRLQARPGHHLVANGKTGHRLNVDF